MVSPGTPDFEKSQQANIPVPDPSILTTENLRREVAALKDLLGTRINAIEKAFDTFAESITRIPTETDRQVNQLKELHAERFNSIRTQFEERDVRSRAIETAGKEAAAAQAIAANTAVSAALQAQKESAFATQQSNAEAIRKSEAGFTNEINSLKALINSTKETLAATVGDLRSRLDRGEGSAVGARHTRAESHMNAGGVLGIVGAVVGVIALLASLAFGLVNALHQSAAVAPVPAAVAVVPVAPK